MAAEIGKTEIDGFPGEASKKGGKRRAAPLMKAVCENMIFAHE